MMFNDDSAISQGKKKGRVHIEADPQSFQLILYSFVKVLTISA